MTLHLTRYYADLNQVKGILLIDGTPFCETREPGRMAGRNAHLSPGTYPCRCRATQFSPMTLRVCRQRGQSSVHIGWHALRQWLSGTICVGMANIADPPEERELTRQQATFDQLTQRVYQAFEQAEDIQLTVSDTNPNTNLLLD